jgi:class 3 adenylate cyclase
VSAAAAAAPSGVVTFLFTDIEGSTRRWEADADAMRSAVVAHEKVLRTAIEAHDGFLFSHTGDGLVAAFASPMSAVNAADRAAVPDACSSDAYHPATGQESGGDRR